MKYIEKTAEVSADALSGDPRSGGSTMRSSAIIYSVVNLCDFVKIYDEDFTPVREVEPLCK